jgi:adenylate cyclase
VRPRGLEASLTVGQLLPPETESPVTNEHIALYEQALDALNAGDFERSFSLLHLVPAEDRVKDFLTVFIAQHHRQPPLGWTGIIDLNNSPQ